MVKTGINLTYNQPKKLLQQHQKMTDKSVLVFNDNFTS